MILKVCIKSLLVSTLLVVRGDNPNLIVQSLIIRQMLYILYQFSGPSLNTLQSITILAKIRTPYLTALF